tara:strand:- start:428967 stop:430619 length:1653 start_codon:yes stop_codon:yes gene_type:complete
MKNKIIAILMLATTAIYAQKDMSVVWEAKMEHRSEYKGTGLEGDVSYVASDKEITVFKNDDGSIVWSKKFKEIAPNLRKIDELEPFWKSNVIFLFDRKLGKDQIACVDLTTGDLLWTSDKYQDVTDDNLIYIREKNAFAMSIKKGLVLIDARTGEEFWQTALFSGVVGQYLYDGDTETMTIVNFKPAGLAALFAGFKNQIVRLDINTGKFLWEQKYIGQAERKVISREYLYELDLVEDKVMLRLNGLQAFDYKTGKALWSAAFDFSPEGAARKPAGKVLKFGVYGAVADPVISGDYIYVLDMSRKNKQFINKYDKYSGNLVWTSPEIKGGARAIPNMYVVGNRVILQIGGIVEVQSVVEKKTTVNGVTTTTKTTKISFENVKPNGVQAFDTESGQFAWDSERFKKGITNMLSIGDDIIVCSGKAYYGLKGSNGAELYERSIKDDGIGWASSIFEHNGKIVVVGAKGISFHDIETGKLTASNKYKNSTLESVQGDILVMKTASADIAAFDLNDCSYTEFKAKNDAHTWLSLTSEYVYIYENKKVKKVKTRG